MEYSESIIYGNITDQITCQRCGASEHKVNGIIKYAYILLAFIPFYPVKKSVHLECTQCLALIEEDKIPKTLISDFKKSLFKLHIIALNYIGLFLLLLMTAVWFYHVQQENKLTNEYLVAPKVDDFYFLDYRFLANNLPKNDNYRLAKVVDITGDIVSLVYSSSIYNRESILADSIKSGQVLAGRNYGRKR